MISVHIQTYRHTYTYTHTHTVLIKTRDMKSHSLIQALLPLALLLCMSEGKLVAKDNFNAAKGSFNPADPNSDYFFFSGATDMGLYVADDTNIMQGNQLVTLDSNPYTKDVPQGPFGTFSHIPNLQYRKQAIAVGSNERMVYDLRISGACIGSEQHPFPAELVTDPEDDPRLGCSFMNMLDPTTLIVTDIAITNKSIWALYERLPFGQEFDFYRAFTSLRRIATRKSPDEVHNLAISYDREQGSVSWSVNGQTKYTVSNLGFLPTDPEAVVILDHGGVEKPVDPSSFLVGFGNIELLDGTDPNNPSSQTGLVQLVTGIPGFYQKPLSFHDTASLLQNRRFGQGSITKVYKLKVRVF